MSGQQSSCTGAKDFGLNLSVLVTLFALALMAGKASPDIAGYLANDLFEDLCHLATFSIGVFICHLAVAPTDAGGHQQADNSTKIRVPLYLL
mmetsp:Transcript_85712/g.243030  ORF Transcript_85712/g.243030 Transcript_85712/m.243030 type:complete len:92 (+) Transcript_85712:79-354(+)